MAARIRKQVNSLTIEDIQRHPLWSYCLDEEGTPGQDECTVRPVAENEGQEKHIDFARATFTLADGSKYVGLIDYGNSASDKNPVIFTLGGQVYLSLGFPLSKSLDEQLKQRYALLDKAPEHVFPIRWVCDDSSIGLAESGLITGFSYFEMLDDITEAQKETR